MSLRYIVPALAVAGRALAQCGSGETLQVQNSGDVPSSCTTYRGSIEIASQTAGDIELTGIRTITGSLTATNATELSSLSAPSLEEIGEDFTLESLTILTTLNFPMLVKVNSIMWTALPALQGLSFTTGLQEANEVSIINTELASLEGINLQVADVITVTNNNYLDAINMQLGNITQSLTLGANGRNLKAEFPNLEWAYNMTFRNCSEVSIPSLASINGSLGFYSNTFETLSAPNLTTVGGSLSFVSNEDLTNITMSELTTVGGGLQIANNTALENINGFPKLATVGGALDFNGAFTEVDLPDISDIRGAFNMQSTGNLDKVCSTFQALAGSNNVIKGEYTCSGEESSPGGAGTLPDGTNSGGGSSSSSSAAHPMLIPGATGVLGVIAAIFGLL